MINLLIGASLLALAKSVYYLKKTQLNFTSNLFDQNSVNPKSNY